MNNTVTVVMYHYVRASTDPFPMLKSLPVSAFDQHLDLYASSYSVIDAATMAAAIKKKIELPPRSILLTFDDGYREHYEHVFPRLQERGWSGCFYPVVKATLRNELLGVNKIHLLLAHAEDAEPIVSRIEGAIDNSTVVGELRSRFWKASRFDPADVAYIKRLLQKGLPAGLRAPLLKALYVEFVPQQARTAASTNFYLDVDQLRLMVEAGMHVGAHTENHEWLDELPRDLQDAEVAASADLIDELGAGDLKTIAYPYGACDLGLRRRLARSGWALGFSTEVGVADLGRNDPLFLPRIDANDVPDFLS